jgi:hypothetical protein
MGSNSTWDIIARVEYSMNFEYALGQCTNYLLDIMDVPQGKLLVPLVEVRTFSKRRVWKEP